MACPQPGPVYQVRRVQQFTFRAEDDVLACVYDAIAALDESGAATSRSVNIRAVTQVDLESIGCGCGNLVKIVPGNSFGVPFEEATQTANDLAFTEDALQRFCLDYQQQTVLFVDVPSNLQGQLRRVQALLNAVGVNIISTSIDESTFSIYEVSDLARATAALQLNVCEQNDLIRDSLRCKKVRKANCNKCSRCDRKEEDKCDCEDKHHDDKHEKKDDKHDEKKDWKDVSGKKNWGVGKKDWKKAEKKVNKKEDCGCDKK